MSDIQIRPFQTPDQAAVRALILAGLAEHFGVLDPTLNHDLEDIQSNYLDQDECFLVVFDGKKLIGTGALINEAPGTGRIVRMSVAAHRRRQGLAHRLVQELISKATELGYTKIVVETNDDWLEAIRLYQRCGFRPYSQRNGEIHMERDL
jgi:ribosomal protein S18 acetylase RimI-like enzyme